MYFFFYNFVILYYGGDKMKKNILVEFKDSIFNLNSYVEYPKQSLKRCFLYLLLLSVLIGSFSLIRVFEDFNSIIGVLDSAYENNIPNIIITNGKIDLKGDVKEFTASNNDTFLMIKTDKPTNESELIGIENGVLITQEKIYLKIKYITQEISLSPEINMEFDKELIKESSSLLNNSKYILIIMGIIALYISILFSSGFISFFSFLLLNAPKLPFSGVFKITAHAITLPSILICFENILEKSIPFSSIIFYAITILYVNFALVKILSNKLKS